MQKAKSLSPHTVTLTTIPHSFVELLTEGLTPHTESWAPIGHPKHHMASVISFPCAEPLLQCYMYMSTLGLFLLVLICAFSDPMTRGHFSEGS